MFENIMSDTYPSYSGIRCDGASMKVYVVRSEWSKLSSFQAKNTLMLASLLPHTDNTDIQYIDDRNGQVLARFTMKQPMGSIAVVHP